jgi:hypothetical protein
VPRSMRRYRRDPAGLPLTGTAAFAESDRIDDAKVHGGGAGKADRSPTIGRIRARNSREPIFCAPRNTRHPYPLFVSHILHTAHVLV